MVQFRSMAVAGLACSLLCDPTLLLAVDVKPTPNVVAAAADNEFRCASRMMTFFKRQSEEATVDKKALLAFSGRLSPFVTEVENALWDRYQIKIADLSSAFERYRDEASAEYLKDKAGSIALSEKTCGPVLAARETSRIPASPQRCWAHEAESALTGMLTGGMIGMLSGMSTGSNWQKWARADLVQHGMKAKAADKQLEAERKALSKDVETANKSGHNVVYDKANCEARFKTFREQNPAIFPVSQTPK